MRAILSVLVWIVTAMATLVVFAVTSFVAIFLPFVDRKRTFCHSVGFWWAQTIISLNPFWDLRVEGLENIKPHKTYVVVCNHQSLADIALVYKTHMQFKWVAKEVLFRIPFFGVCMKNMKYIKLARGELGSIKEVYEEASGWLKNGVSVLFFPEGTRSGTVEMRPFKNGAFKLAIQEKKFILPISITGSHAMIPRGGWIFKARATCIVRILPEISTAGFGEDDFAKLRDMVRATIAKEIG